jgi:hypothetical protein
MWRVFAIEPNPDQNARKEAFLSEWKKQKLPEIQRDTMNIILNLKEEGQRLEFTAGKRKFAARIKDGKLCIFKEGASLSVILLAVAATVVILLIGISMLGFQEKKPAIYLYPEHDMQVSVKLHLNGEITENDPPYGQGWDVFATKGGRIDGKYDYLYYEAKINSLEVPEEGWVVRYEDLGGWLDATLPRLGLNEKEKAEFKEYWMAKLPKANYYEVKLLGREFLEKNMRLEVSPEPDTDIRIILCFRPLGAPEQITEPAIITPERKGFTVVEWGGLVYNKWGGFLYS